MKKILGIIFIGVLFLELAGCDNKEVNYQGIYELNGVKIKTYLVDNTIAYVVESDAISTYGNAELNKNVVKLDNVSENTTLTFKSGKASLKTDYEFIKGGNYTRTGNYEKEDFYNDFYGKKEYLTAELNGVYTKGNIKINVYQNNDNSIRILYTLDDNSSDLEMYEEDSNYTLDFFDTIYNIKFDTNKMIVDVQTNTESSKVLSGTYTKESNLGLDEIITTYDPN